MDFDRLLRKSHVRWFIVGCFTVVIDTTLFLAVFHITKNAVASNLFSGTIATSFNYFSHYHWSFTSDREHTHSTILYLTFFFLFLFLGTSIIRHLLDQNVPPFIAKTGTAAVFAPLSFLIMKFVTFRRKNNG